MVCNFGNSNNQTITMSEKDKYGTDRKHISIIKKFLYSDQEIFLRELVSMPSMLLQNANAIFKRRGQRRAGWSYHRYCIRRKCKTLTIRDRGIGLTEDEAKISKSSRAFFSTRVYRKYKGESNIIGHFGLGASILPFMVAEIDVISLSYQEGAQAIQWSWWQSWIHDWFGGKIW